MQKNKTNNIIFLKNVESNIIEEAIVILRKNIKLENFENTEDNKNINILKEAESIINQRIDTNQMKFDKYRINKLEIKIKRLKIINIVLIISLLLFFIL